LFSPAPREENTLEEIDLLSKTKANNRSLPADSVKERLFFHPRKRRRNGDFPNFSSENLPLKAVASYSSSPKSQPHEP
jgi:hypothetical protein